MRWRTKAAIQRGLSHTPGSGRINYLLQTKVTHSLPASEETFEEILTTARGHLAAIEAVLPGDVAELRGYEFGAGWHLGVAIALAGLGVGQQTLVDRHPLAAPELVEHSLRVLALALPDSKRLREALDAADVDAALALLGITYLAPVDARSTGLERESFDFITSTSTLEHIPEGELHALLVECEQLLRPGGVFSAMIDYGDHYASFDPSITRLNFLRYSPRRWRIWSPPLQFQNRLRHADHLARIEQAGFEPVSVSVVPGTEAELDWLRAHEIDEAFRHLPLEDVSITDAHIVCVRPR